MGGYWPFSKEEDPEWDFEEQSDLPPAYHEDPQQICGHWHKTLGSSTSLPNPILFGCGLNTSGQLGTLYYSYISVFTKVDMSLVNNISVGSYSACLVKNNNTLWVIGNNELYQLGLGHALIVSAYTQVAGGAVWSKAKMGAFFMVALKLDGTLWGVGTNGSGQLGQGDTVALTSLTQMGVASDWVDVEVSMGGIHVMAINSSGELWAVGENGNGQLGQGDTTDDTSLTQVGVATNWSKLTLGRKSSTVMNTSGEVYSTGYNIYGQLGTGDTVQVETLTQEVLAGTWTGIACGQYFLLAVNSAGELFGAGLNSDRQLGFGDTTPRSTLESPSIATDWVSVDAGDTTSYAVNSSDELWVAGNSSVGQTGLGTYSDVTVFTQVPDLSVSLISAGGTSAYIIDTSGGIYSTGYNESNQIALGLSCVDEFTLMDPSTDWDFIDGGSYNTVALKTDGTMWGTGNNVANQLGLGGAAEDYYYAFTAMGVGQTWTKVACGRAFTIGLRSDGTLWGTGTNTSGQLGQGDFVSIDEFAQIGVGAGWIDIKAGSSAFHFVALKSDGTVWVTGENSKGQLGTGDWTDLNVLTQLGAASDWTCIAGGEEHTLCINTSGELWVTGFNHKGQLGLGPGDTTNRNVLTQVGVATNWSKCFGGEYYSYAMKTAGSVYSTGGNYDGQLAQGDTTDRDEFTQIGTATNWVNFALGCSGSHVLGINDSDELYTVGNNEFYQLGRGVTVSEDTSFGQVTYDSESSSEASWSTKLACGIDHSIAIKLASSTSTSEGTGSHDPVWDFVRQVPKL